MRATGTSVAREACRPYGEDVHPRYKRWCDEYFFLPAPQRDARHRRPLLYDDLNEGGFERCFALTRSVGDAFRMPTCPSPRAVATRPSASASVSSSSTAAAAMSSSTWCGIAAPVRPAERWPHRIHSDEPAAARALRVRLHRRSQAAPRRAWPSICCRAIGSTRADGPDGRRRRLWCICSNRFVAEGRHETPPALLRGGARPPPDGFFGVLDAAQTVHQAVLDTAPQSVGPATGPQHALGLRRVRRGCAAALAADHALALATRLAGMPCPSSPTHRGNWPG